MLPSWWFWPAFSRITEYRDIRKQFHWLRKDSNNFCASYEIVSATTQWMLKTKIFEKKIYLSKEKKHFYNFPRNTDFCRRPQQFHQAPQSIQAVLVQVNRSILNDLISCWKRNFLKKKTKGQTFQWKKVSYFFLYYRVWQPSKNILYVSTRSFDIYGTINKI